MAQVTSVAEPCGCSVKLTSLSALKGFTIASRITTLEGAEEFTISMLPVPDLEPANSNMAPLPLAAPL